MTLKPCPLCDKPPIVTVEEEFTSDAKVYRFSCGIHLHPTTDADSVEAAEKVWNEAVDNSGAGKAIRKAEAQQTMADAFVDIARELAAMDARPGPEHEETLQAQFEYLAGCVPDLGTALECDDLQGVRTEATRVAALAVRLLMALPGGE